MLAILQLSRLIPNIPIAQAKNNAGSSIIPWGSNPIINDITGIPETLNHVPSIPITIPFISIINPGIKPLLSFAVTKQMSATERFFKKIIIMSENGLPKAFLAAAVLSIYSNVCLIPGKMMGVSNWQPTIPIIIPIARITAQIHDFIIASLRIFNPPIVRNL